MEARGWWHRLERHHLRRWTPTASSSVPAMAHPGITACAARGRATTCSSPPSSRWMRRPALIGGTIRSTRARAGITTPRWTWRSRNCASVAGSARSTAPKNGFFYVIDRTNGRLISAAPFVKVTWAKRIDPRTGRPEEVPGARFPDGGTFTLWPSMFGAHSWLPMAYSPAARLAYLPAIEMAATYTDRGVDTRAWARGSGPAPDRALVADFNVPDAGPLQGTSSLLAWDPVRQRAAWRVPTPGFWNGGVMATAGNLVFRGRVRRAVQRLCGRPRYVAVVVRRAVARDRATHHLRGRRAPVCHGALGLRFDGRGPRRLPAARRHSHPPRCAACADFLARQSRSAAAGDAAPVQARRRPGLPLVRGRRDGRRALSRPLPQLPRRGRGLRGFAPDLRESAIVLSAEAFASNT